MLTGDVVDYGDTAELRASHEILHKPQKRREIKPGNTRYSLVLRDSLVLLAKNERTSDVVIEKSDGRQEIWNVAICRIHVRGYHRDASTPFLKQATSDALFSESPLVLVFP